ncbi:hypothetical protein CFC21_066911 [Triticum aestivum]|uniref:Amino acid permease/ SLC12A domain-containing protein n=2 Tax=Triticum aestivum TaxID=4565 RepID=A0A9R1H7N8_WHEAT|nr:hypothetical protein CFC21_066911 [Triticum aestivum]
MAELSLLPAVFARRTSYTGIPWVAIAASTVVMITVSFLGFDYVANFLYSLGTLLDFTSFWLRAKHLMLKRPYHVPLLLCVLVAMCAVPSAFLAYVCVVAGWRAFGVAAGLSALGVGWNGVMRLCRAKKLLKFNNAVVAVHREGVEENCNVGN